MGFQSCIKSVRPRCMETRHGASHWAPSPSMTVVRRALIYLAPELERCPQPEVDFTVGHEFAHVYLGKYGAIDAEDDADYYHQNAEMTADELVASWGYPIPGNIVKGNAREVNSISASAAVDHCLKSLAVGGDIWQPSTMSCSPFPQCPNGKGGELHEAVTKL